MSTRTVKDIQQQQGYALAVEKALLHPDVPCLQFNTALQANTWSSFNILKGAAKAMMHTKKGGSIVFTSASGMPIHSVVVYLNVQSW